MIMRGNEEVQDEIKIDNIILNHEWLTAATDEELANFGLHRVPEQKDV